MDKAMKGEIEMDNQRQMDNDERVLRVFYETIERLRKDIRQLSDDELTELKTKLSEWLK